MSQNYSYKRGMSKDDTALYMRDYNTSIKTKKILARLSLVLLLILFAAGFLLSDYIGKELASIMMFAPVILSIIWFVVALLYKGEPPPVFDPPIDIRAEFGKQYFQSPEITEKEEAASRTSRIPRDVALDGTTVSQAIMTGDLLPLVLANTNGQRVLINGELIVDIDYNFRTSSTIGNRVTSEIVMAENSSITISTDVKLNLENTRVRGCGDAKWNRILINDGAELATALTEIKDANTAVELLDGGTYTALNRTVFKSNNVAIASFGADEKDITININGSGGSAGNLINFFGDNSGYGIYLSNTNPISVRGCLFDDLFIGISTVKSSLMLHNCNFVGNQFGVTAKGTIGLINIRESTFENSYAGVYLSGSVGFMEYSKNSSLSNSIGLFLVGAANSEIRIESNNFFQDRVGVGGHVFQSNGRIQQNNMNCGLHNVRLSGLGGVDHLWEVSFNKLRLTNESLNSSNVFLNNMNCARIFKNEKMEGRRNVHIAGGSDNVVGYNTAMTGEENSIYIMDSPLSQIYCNEVAADQAFKLLNNCSGADIRGNDFSGSGANVQYGSRNNPYALAGPQAGKGNIFDLAVYH